MHPDADQVEQMIRAAMVREDWAEVSALEARLEELTSTIVPSLWGAALWYAEQGLWVFPLQPRTKVPFPHSAGFKDASTSRDQVMRWWHDEPHSNIGIATGHLVDVIDLDGPPGLLAWQATSHQPETIGIVSTPRPGGSHLYVRATGFGNRTGIMPHVDYRGLGGYALLPPSYAVEPKKGYEGRYRWRRPLSLAALPAERDPPQGPVTCAVCGEPMSVVEAGQTTHPCCAPEAP